MDFREGGFRHYPLVGTQGGKHWSRYDFKKIEPGKSITERKAFCDENGTIESAFPHTKRILTFGSGESKTLVTMTEIDGSPDIL